MGLGVSVIFVSLIKAYSAWFRPSELGTVLGLTVSVGNLGGILAASPLAGLVDLIGWRHAFLTVGLFSLFVAALSWFVVRNGPREVFPADSGASARATCQAASWILTLKNIAVIVRNRHVWLALAASFCIYGPFMALVGVWGVPYLMQVYSLGRTEAATVILMASLGVMLGTFGVGFISDRVGSRRKVYLAFALANVLVWAALVWWNQGMPPLKSLYFLYFMVGFCGNACMLTPVIVKEYYPLNVAGLASGIGNIGGFVGSAFMQPFFGFLLDMNWDGAVPGGVKLYSQQDFQFAFGSCFLFGCLAVIAVSLLRESLQK